MKINNALLEKILEYKTNISVSCDGLGLVEDKHGENLLSFLDMKEFETKINSNDCISTVFISKELLKNVELKEKKVLICDDPRFNYYTLFNYLCEKNYRKKNSIIHRSSKISNKSFISIYNVKIGKNVLIEPNVTILPDVVIGDNSIIRAGAVLGAVGFEHKRTSKGILSVYHDGKVIIGKNVEIGANTCIDKGFSYRNTIVGNGTKVDDLVYIAHCVNIGENCLIIANATIMGSVTIKNNVWIGPNSTIAPHLTIEDNGFITLGSVVTKNVNANQWVSGNFAIPHDKFILNLKKKLK